MFFPILFPWIGNSRLVFLAALLLLSPQAGAFVPYERWVENELTEFSGSEWNVMSDPDGDELDNAVEWYCGLRPGTFDGHPLSVEVVDSEAVVQFQRSLDAIESAGVIEVSTDGVFWQMAPATPVALSTSLTHELLELRMALASFAVPRLMIRLAVTVPEEAARWSFDGTTDDKSKSGNDGVPKGGAVLGDGVAGTEGLVLDGTDDYLEVSDDAGLRLDAANGEGRSFTIAGWIRLDEDAPLATEDDEYTILQKGIWTRPPFVQFGVRGGAFRGLWARIYSPDLTSHAYLRILPKEDISSLLPGQWRHVAFTRDEAGTGRLFLDGRKVAENLFMSGPVDSPVDAVSAGGAVSPLHKVWIGRNYGHTGGYFRGKIDELRVYRRALDESEIGGLVTANPPEPEWERWAGYPPEDEAGTIYVAPEGNDGNPGTRDEPVASIGKALDMAHDPAETRLRIFVAHGEYYEGINRFLNPDSALSNRLPGELVIARQGINMEAEPPGLLPGQRVVVKGAVRKEMPPGHPLAGLFPQWDGLGDGLYRAERIGQQLNAQTMFLDGVPLRQSGDAWICSSLGDLMTWSRYIENNNPAFLPENSFYCAEKMKLRVPPQGGAAISDGMRFSVSRGNGADIRFEFNGPGDYIFGPGSIAIPYANGKNAIGRPEGSADTQAELAARIIAALTSPAASSLGLTPVFENGFIDLGPRDRGDGTFMAVSTHFATPLSSHEYELYLKVTTGVDPNASETNLEIPYRTQMLVIRVPGTRVRGFTFMYTNAMAVINATAISVAADDVVFENNDVLWHDWGGIYFYAQAPEGLRPPVRNVLLLNNRFNHCGNNGIIHYQGLDCRMVGNDTSYNNWRQFAAGWHAGGFKFLGTLQRMSIIQHTSRRNSAAGLWFDGVDARARLFYNESTVPDELGVKVTESVAEFNSHAGFFYEISGGGVFYDNVARYNGERGFYLSNAVSTRCERNLSAGNGIDGFGLETNVRRLQFPFFSVPRTHPLSDNWSNFLYYGAGGLAGDRIFNNIIRNNGLYDPAHHDLWDAILGILPTHRSPNYPMMFLPKESEGTDHAPAVAKAVKNNECDHNILWKTGEPIYYGYSPTFFIDFAYEDPRLGIDGGLLDLKDVDFGMDGKADRLWNRLKLFPDGKHFKYLPFPSPDDVEFGQSSVIADRFEFLDPPGLNSEAPNGDDILNPDFDSDGLYDWWEASHGLDSRDNTGVNGAEGDPDGDGLTNVSEFNNWKNGISYSNHSIYLRETDPTRGNDNRNGKPRDLDGDDLPDLWETWFGLDPSDGADGELYVEAFLRNELPLPLANDSDVDGLPDDWEMTAFGTLDEGAEEDFDTDGISNFLEFRYWTLPFDGSDPIDADKDGLPDSWELGYGFQLLPAAQRGAAGDPDGDGSTNIEEFRALTNPREVPEQP
jgi:hypothetical protein